MTYKEDFESERRDREAVHTKIAEMESRYRHQLEAIGDQLKKVTEEKEGHRQTVTKTEALLHQQRQQMMGQLQEREVEMSSTLQNIQKLQVHNIQTHKLIVYLTLKHYVHVHAYNVLYVQYHYYGMCVK